MTVLVSAVNRLTDAVFFEHLHAMRPIEDEHTFDASRWQKVDEPSAAFWLTLLLVGIEVLSALFHMGPPA